MNRVIIVGAGAAGIAAACYLSSAGVTPVLIERTSRLGGRAASFAYTVADEEIDYGHHVLMRSCTATQELLDLIGTADAVRFQPRLRVPIRYPGGKTAIYSAPLPGPLHLLPGLMRYSPLHWGERFNAIRAGISLLTTKPRHEETFGSWLHRHGQRERAIATLWAPITVATLNAPPNAVSVHTAKFVLTTGFFRPHGATIGLFTRPLSRVFAPAERFITDRGGTVRYGRRVERIVIEDGTAVGVRLVSGEELAADAVIIAVSPDRVQFLLPADVREDRFFARVSAVQFSPIVNVHLWFDRAVTDEEMFVGVNTPVQAVFNVSKIHRRAGVTHVVLSQSAADALMPLTNDAIIAQLVAALGQLLPTARHAHLIDALVVRHPRATFISAPGTDAIRPPNRTPIDHLYLAGDYTRTGWPATIESAVRSGRLAADAILTGRR